MKAETFRYARPRLMAAAVGAWMLIAGPATARAEARRDPKAVAVADAVEEAIAPGGAWGKIAGLKFSFTVAREGKPQKSFEHVWDTRTGRYRVEGEGPDGGKCLVLFDVNTKQGEAWALQPTAPQPPPAGQVGSPQGEGAQAKKDEGAPSAKPGATAGEGAAAKGGFVVPASWVRQRGESLAKLLEYGYGRFINDTYWLLMPIKLKDPGVNLDYDGEKTEGGDTFDVLKVTFENVGLTPGDTYWAWVNRKTHLVERWEFVLQGQEAKDKSSWVWKDWSRFGPLRLSTTKTGPDGKVSIAFAGVEVFSEMPAQAFDPPE